MRERAHAMLRQHGYADGGGVAEDEAKTITGDGEANSAKNETQHCVDQMKSGSGFLQGVKDGLSLLGGFTNRLNSKRDEERMKKSGPTPMGIRGMNHTTLEDKNG